MDASTYINIARISIWPLLQAFGTGLMLPARVAHVTWLRVLLAAAAYLLAYSLASAETPKARLGTETRQSCKSIHPVGSHWTQEIARQERQPSFQELGVLLGQKFRRAQPS